MKSITLTSGLHAEWLESATPRMVSFVDRIYAECERRYSDGGDSIVECFSPEEVWKKFFSFADAMRYCNLKEEQDLEARGWGEV